VWRKLTRLVSAFALVRPSDDPPGMSQSPRGVAFLAGALK
jgi:hypothetical protein